MSFYYDKEEHCYVKEEDIDDVSYFNMIDNQIRNVFSSWEVENCLPAVRIIWARSNVPDIAMENYPVEGYYSQSKELTELFIKIRNIQQNTALYKKISTQNNDLLDFLKSVYENEIMGEEPSSWYPWPDSPMKRRYDIMTLTMQDKNAFNEHAQFPWDIPTIVKSVGSHYKGRPNLVELAYLANDPRCLCAGCETNALSRMYACLSGSYSLGATKTIYNWKVSKEMESLGTKLVEGYQKIMSFTGPFGNKNETLKMVVPTKDNAHSLVMTFKTPRIAHLGYLLESKLNYFWILDVSYRMYDIYTPHFITTESFGDDCWDIQKAFESRNKIWMKAGKETVNLSEDIYKPSWNIST